MVDQFTRNPDHQLALDRVWYVEEFGKSKARTIMRELQHYNLYGELPADATIVERIEWVNGGAIIIHRDPDEVRH